MAKRTLTLAGEAAATKTREGICLALPKPQAALLRDLARRMGLSQKSLREHLEASPVFAEAVNEALKRKWNTWNEARAKEDPFAALSPKKDAPPRNGVVLQEDVHA